MKRYVAWAGAVVVLAAAGCPGAAELRAVSAGQIGCIPDDVEISSQTEEYTARGPVDSWTATCHDKVFHCSARRGADTSCTEEGGGSSGGVNNAAPAAGQAFPVTVAGFRFGQSRAEAEEACTKSGHAWGTVKGDAPPADMAVCDGAPTDVGFATEVTLQFCREKACRIVLSAPTDGPVKDWAGVYGSIEQTLITKYGTPAERPFTDAPSSCVDDVTPCLKDGRAGRSAIWRWGKSMIRVRLGRLGAPAYMPVMAVEYDAAGSGGSKPVAPDPGAL